MSKLFTDENFLTWEAYPSGGDHGFTDNPYIVFNCVTDPQMRARLALWQGDEADAERALAHASAQEMLDLFKRTSEID